MARHSSIGRHEVFMRKCLQLAAKGSGYVGPNPMVGAVLVSDEKIVARGYHKYFGGPHAESDCLRRFKGETLNATLYVNLEPCSHFGKTPPCIDLLLQRGIRNVVVAMEDPNPMVAGKGIAKLKRAGIKVTVGVMEDEAKRLNRFFITHISSKRPYIHLKIAQTLDGFIASGNGRMQYITSLPSRQLVHEWRTKYDAILVGAGTIKVDNPQLNVRLAKGREPAVVILDGKLTVGQDSNVFGSAHDRPVFLCVSSFFAKRKRRKAQTLKDKGVRVIEFDSHSGHLDLQNVLKELYGHIIGSILVEGGSQVFSEFVRGGLVDELSVFIAHKSFGTGVRPFDTDASTKVTRMIMQNQVVQRKVGSDLLLTGLVK